jgi:hypothetical protein
MRRWLKGALIALAVWLAQCTGASAQAPESEQSEAARWLAVAFVAEAGWADPKHAKAEADHRAIFHVLRRRWGQMRRRWPKIYPRFVDVLQAYVAAFDPRTEKGQRVRWLLALVQHDDLELPPASWPEANARWDVHRPWWEAALERAEGCLAGRRCPDPYRGRALHWGGAMDAPRGCMRELPNPGLTFNTFYAVDTQCARTRNRRKR